MFLSTACDETLTSKTGQRIDSRTKKSLRTLHDIAKNERNSMQLKIVIKDNQKIRDLTLSHAFAMLFNTIQHAVA